MQGILCSPEALIKLEKKFSFNKCHLFKKQFYKCVFHSERLGINVW